MTLTIDLSPEQERQLREEAARTGQAPEEYARGAIEEKLAAVVAAQADRNEALVALLRQWREEPADADEADGYPLEITPLSLREVFVE